MLLIYHYKYRLNIEAWECFNTMESFNSDGRKIWMFLTYISVWLVNKEPEALTTIQPSNIKRPAVSNALPRITDEPVPWWFIADWAKNLPIFRQINNKIHCSAFQQPGCTFGHVWNWCMGKRQFSSRDQLIPRKNSSWRLRRPKDFAFTLWTTLTILERRCRNVCCWIPRLKLVTLTQTILCIDLQVNFKPRCPSVQRYQSIPGTRPHVVCLYCSKTSSAVMLMQRNAAERYVATSPSLSFFFFTAVEKQILYRGDSDVSTTGLGVIHSLRYLSS